MNTTPGHPTMTFQREDDGAQRAIEPTALPAPTAGVPEAEAEGPAQVDPRVIAERVYRLMRDEIEIERIRRGW